MNNPSKIIIIAYLVSILLLLSIALVALWDISKLEEQINKRDILIRELTISEEQVNKYFNKEEN